MKTKASTLYELFCHNKSMDLVKPTCWVMGAGVDDNDGVLGRRLQVLHPALEVQGTAHGVPVPSQHMCLSVYLFI